MTPAEAFRRFGQAAFDVAAALDAAEQEHRQAPRAAKATSRITPPTLDLAATKALDAVPAREGLTKSETKILIALAQAARPLTLAQIGTRCGLSSGTGPFAKAVAGLRASGFAVGPGSALQITAEGLEALGPFPRLPEGQALFEYWCQKVGSSGGKILRALRDRHRQQLGPASLAELGAATGLSHGTGPFAKTLATLRRLELIEGPGTANVLTVEMQRAAEVTFAVHDRQSGRTVRVDRGGKAVG